MEAIGKVNLDTISPKDKWAIILIAFGIMMAFSWLAGMNYGTYIVSLGIWKWFTLFMVCLSIVIPLHEGLHALFFRLFGGKVRFGATLKTRLGPVFWATSDKLFPKRQFRIIALAPQVLTLICIVIALFDIPTICKLGLWIIAAGNLAGGGFDIYISCLLGRFPAGALFQDQKDGIQVYIR
jgi:hypothetical protein